ncbi:DUF1573 domain-containing protein, partial [Planctomycetota bacterium]
NSRIYDCAANTLFVMCQISDVQVSYEKCLELLPITSKGNSMLEVKQALESLGFNVKPLSITTDEIANIRVPTIMWAHPPEGDIVRKDSRNIGHYIIVIPVDNNSVQVLDFPQSPVILPVQPWSRHLSSNGIENIPLILCGRKDQEFSEMFSPDSKNSDSDKKTTEDVPYTNSKLFIKSAMSNSSVLYWDFGDISEGSFLKHNFTLVNDTGKTLNISKLSKSCTCGYVTTDKSIIAPGESCTATVSVSLAGRIGGQNISSTVVFDEKDEVQPITLLITGNSQSRWTMQPKVIDFGSIEFGSEIQSQNLLVKPTEYGINASLSHVECKSPIVDVEIKSNSEDPNSYILSVSVDPNKYPGTFSEQINFLSEGQKEPVLSCTITGELYIDINVQPTRLFLISSQSPMGTVRLIQKDLKPISLLSLEIIDCENDNIDVTPVTVEKGQGLQLNVNVLEKKSKSLRGNLKLDLRVGDESKIRSVTIPFFYMK